MLSQEALRLLEQHHQFPSQYMFKVIGFAGPQFMTAVQAAAESVLGVLENPERQLRCRPSSGGRYLSITLEVVVADAAQVLAIYGALKQVQGVVVLV
jgi:putative lipoic acid-binding regulatory protein